MKTSPLRFPTKTKTVIFLLSLFFFSFTGMAQMINCPANATLECGDSTDPADTGMATTTGDCPPSPAVWINELHYDNGNPGNGGADVGEFIEIAGTAGFDLSTCQIYFYNGNNGNTYGGSGGFRNLSGTIDDEGMGYGALSFSIADLGISSIQNGAPDGLALACNGALVQFISYEGSFVAAGNSNYPAFGMMSTDIGVEEGSTTPIGFSLQLNGMGSTYDQFNWMAPSAESPGSLNAGQSISPPLPPMITFSDAGGPAAAGCGQYQYSITRTWSATFSCGTVLTCNQMINVEDNTAPTITCPANVTVDCDESTDPMDTGEATAIDNCMAPVVPAVWINEIHYDNQGADVNEFVEVAGTAGFDLSTCAIYLYNGSTGNLYNSNPPNALVGTIDDEGAGYGAVSLPISPLQNGMNSNGTDADGLALVCDGVVIQFLTYEGVITAGNGPAAGMTSVDIGVLEESNTPVGNSLQLTGMGNAYADFTWTGPVAESPGSLNAAQSINLEANDVVITSSDVSTQGMGCSEFSYTITRTWTATDACGNGTDCVQVITVEDTTPPAIVCPANVNLSCTDSTDPGDTGTATGADNCSAVGEVVITSSDISTEGAEGCSQFTFTILRTWLATDACGNSTTCVQTIEVADTEPPVISCPPSQTLTCFETTPAPLMTAADFIAAGGTIADNCTTEPTDFTVFSQNDDNGGDNCPGNGRTIVRTYFIQDACGNTSSCTQTFTYLESTEGPVVTSVLPTCYKYCASLANPMEGDITYDTDCSFGATVNIAGPTQIGADNCPGTIYRYTYTVTDDCGRTSLPVTRDFIIGNDGPTIQCAPFNLLLECGDPNNTDYIADHIATAAANSSCELGVTINHFPQNFNNITCNSSTVVTFIATDDCGRTASCTTTINISDNTAPVITSTYVDGVCNEAVCGSNVNFFFNFWKEKVLEGLSATDACDSNVSFTTSGPNSPLQNCPDGTAETVITFVANDNCGNTSGIDYSFYVVPAEEPAPAPGISGLVATEDLETVAEVTVTLEGNSNSIVTQTESYGLYAFASLEEGANYAVTPYSNEDPLNGISSFDLVLISKHILQLEQLDSPYKMIAADINKSGSITTMDLVELRKLILHVDDEFANNTSWRFVGADYVFPEANNPFATVFPEVMFINGLAVDMQQDFVGVKIGDVNGSVIANAFPEVEDRTTVGDLNFNVKDQQLVAGEQYEVIFQADNFEGIHGYQFTLNFDETVLEFNSLNAGVLEKMSENNFGVSLLEKGVITTSWTNQAAITLNRDAAVFTILFTAKEDGMLSEVISLGSKYTKAEAYNADLELMNVSLRFDSADSITSGFRLYQNTPNPFKGETVIGFELPEAMAATLTIYDVTGRVLKQVDDGFAKGYNEVTIDRADLAIGSVFYYHLVTDGFEESRKMVMIE